MSEMFSLDLTDEPAAAAPDKGDDTEEEDEQELETPMPSKNVS